MKEERKKWIRNSSSWLKKHGGSVVNCLKNQEKRIKELEKTERKEEILIEVSRMIKKRTGK